jgi:hypothetical protein
MRSILPSSGWRTSGPCPALTWTLPILPSGASCNIRPIGLPMLASMPWSLSLSGNGTRCHLSSSGRAAPLCSLILRPSLEIMEGIFIKKLASWNI